MSQLQSLLADTDQPAEVEREMALISRIHAEAAEEEQRGLEEIRSADPEKGIFRLQRIFDRFPERRAAIAEPLGMALIRQGDRLLAARDWAGAEARYLAAITTEPELVTRVLRQHTHVKVQQIEPALRAGDFATVAARCAEGLEVDPASRTLRYYRGLALEARGKRREAAEEYLSLIERKRPANLEAAVADLRLEVESQLTAEGSASPQAPPRAREALPGKARELRTSHFSIWHRNPEIAREVALVAERAYAHTFSLLRCAVHLRQPIQIHVYPTREEYLAASGLEAWSGGAHRVARPMGVLSEHRIYTFQDQPGLSTGILPHEIRHALLAHRLNYPDRLPLWANEGFAVLGEARYIHDRYRRLLRQEARRQTLLPIKEILERDRYPAESVDLYYAQCFSLTELLIELEGLEVFLRFLKQLTDPGTRVESALRAHYSLAGIQALENRWLGSLERPVR
jgi:tetratricopeptide (TPR) repeat protein